MFPQASIEDRAGVLLHRIPSGTWLHTINMHSLFLYDYCCRVQQFTLSCGVVASLMFLLMGYFHCISQNQLLTKGMVILRDKIRFYEGMSDWMKGLNASSSGLWQNVGLQWTVVAVWLMQVRSCSTLWQRPGTSFSVTFSPCCRPSSIQFRYANTLRVLKASSTLRPEATLALLQLWFLVF